MSDISDYEQQISNKREQNKDKLKELGLTPIITNKVNAKQK